MKKDKYNIENTINDKHIESRINKWKLDRLTFDLKYSNYSYAELAIEYGISENHIKAINYGNAWKRGYIEYPIRKTAFSGKRDDEVVAKIQRDLISTRVDFEDLASRYGCSTSTIRRINIGEAHKNTNYSYPLRKPKKTLGQKELNEIHELLLNTEVSINQISERYGVSSSTIKRINNGDTKKYIDSRYVYPLRKL